METTGEVARAQAIAAQTAADATKSAADTASAALTQSDKALRATLAQGQKALDTTVDSSRLDRRAWIGINTMSVLQFVKDKPLRVDIGFFNSGRTPALRVNDGSKYIFPNTFVTGPDSTWPMNFRMEPQQSVPPQGGFTRHIEMTTQSFAEHYDAIKGGMEFVYFYGQITYTDTSEIVKGLTQFCIFLRMVDDKPDLAFCSTFNDLK